MNIVTNLKKYSFNKLSDTNRIYSLFIILKQIRLVQ